MPKLLYAQAEQLANLKQVLDPGFDVQPGNVLKLAFVMRGTNPFTEATIGKKTEWDKYLKLPDGDPKLVVVTPYIDAFKIAPTTPLTEGGNDTTTPNGMPRQRSTSFAEGSGKISAMSTAQADALRAIAAKTGNFQHGTRVEMYLLHEGNGIGVKDKFRGIPITNLFISDPEKGGLGATDDFNIMFHVEGGWSVGTSTVAADFEAGLLVNVPAAPVVQG